MRRVRFLFPGRGGLGTDNAYGLLTLDSTPKPSYATFSYTTSIIGLMDTGKSVTVLSFKNPKLEGYEFALTDGRHVQIVWNKADNQQILYQPQDRVKSISNPIGTQIPVTGATVVVNDEPRFIFTRE